MDKNVETVSGYIAAAPKWAQPVLREFRKAIRAAAPKAKETISYHMPYYAQDGRLAYFGVYKNHCSFHWISASDKKMFAKELAKQKVIGSTLQIPRGGRVPVLLIKKIVKMRLKSNVARKK